MLKITKGVVYTSTNPLPSNGNPKLVQVSTRTPTEKTPNGQVDIMLANRLTSESMAGSRVVRPLGETLLSKNRRLIIRGWGLTPDAAVALYKTLREALKEEGLI